MPTISSTTLSTAPSEIDGIALVVRRHPRARRMKLRYDGERDRLLLTVPPRASLRRAYGWACTQRPWIARQRAARVEPLPLLPGNVLPYRGATLTLVHNPDAPRRAMIDGDRLIIGGPIDGFARRAESWLKREARRLLSADVAEFAARGGLDCASVSVGNARTRWGSCTSGGRIRFNWRLVCAPDAVRRYVAAHEVAHRRHMDHGRAFHALEEELFGGPVEAERKALLALGPGLQRIAR